jgi:hypothetical protein
MPSITTREIHLVLDDHQFDRAVIAAQDVGIDRGIAL